jgi:hypothetical protein
MPLIAYKGAHGGNDFPHHFIFFEYLEKAGFLDRYDFAVETWDDPAYAAKLLYRFPRLKLVEDVSVPRKALRWMERHVGRGYRPLSFADTKFDAVIEAPGGRISGAYGARDVFRMYPRVKRRAIVFHSIETGAMKHEDMRRSVGTCELVVTRTPQSAAHAREAGAARVVDSADITFLEHPKPIDYRPGIAAALRVPNKSVTSEYLQSLRTIVDRLSKIGKDVDFVLVEEPFGTEMRA